ncbi:hypothetical protein HYU09_00895 [Candidatus Woesearchaeota archaeon]|nr:hypothetical protein [Candidatus Woesearchaeota archaeon]
MNIKNKRGQAAVFIIIGLIILITAGVIFFIQREEIKPIEKESGEQPQFAGQAELKNFVDSCLQSSVLQGLQIMSLQGGYIDIPADSNILTADGNDIPYWLTADSVAIPSLDFMQTELENYVVKELESCVSGFKDFKDQGFEVNYSSIKADAAMGKAVVVNVDFPIMLKKEGISFEEKDFVYTVPIDMELIQKTASGLAALEDFHTYLEDHTKNLISLYSGVDQNRLPPFSQSTTNLNCNFVSWSKEEVKNRLKNILNFNVPNLKIEGTNYNLAGSDAVYESFVYDLFNENFPNLKIDFIYENSWEFLAFDIVPSSGNSLIPEKVVGTNIPMLPQICVFKYPFKYTMQYPVLIKITDLNSAKIDPAADVYYEKQGFAFQFPMVSYLCGNQNRKCVAGNFPQIDVTSFAVGNTTLLPQTLFCKPEQMISNEITVKTFDSLTANSLSNVDVNYYCGSYQNDCFIGRTDGNGVLKAKFPLCINGQIYFAKEGYSILGQGLTTHEIPKSELAYFLNPKNSLKVEMKKVSILSLVQDYFENNKLNIENSLQDVIAGEKVTIVSDTGLFYIYPDPADRTLQIGTGNHKFGLQLTAENASSLGFLNADASVSKEDLRKSKVVFYVFEDSSTDSILRADGNLEAELLYSCGKNADDSCNFDSCSFAGIDGLNIRDFNDNLETCEKAFNITIAKEQYRDLIKPVFS